MTILISVLKVEVHGLVPHADLRKAHGLQLCFQAFGILAQVILGSFRWGFRGEAMLVHDIAEYFEHLDVLFTTPHSKGQRSALLGNSKGLTKLVLVVVNEHQGEVSEIAFEGPVFEGQTLIIGDGTNNQPLGFVETFSLHLPLKTPFSSHLSGQLACIHIEQVARGC